MKSTNKTQYFYTYKITNIINNMSYIGRRTSNCKPHNDLGIKYFSSSHDIDFMEEQQANPQNFKYEVLEEFNNCELSLLHEIYLHEKYDVGKNPLFYNRSKQTSIKFDTTNRVTVKDKSGNTFHVDKDDPKYLKGDLVGIQHNKISVKDKSGNTFSVDRTDARYLNGELVHVTKGTVTVKDKNGNTFNVDKDDIRLSNGEVKPLAFNKVTVKDKNGNTFRVDKDDPRIKSRELVGVNLGVISVKDKNGNMFQVDKDDPRIKSGELVGVSKGKRWINKNGIRKTVDPNDLHEFIKEGWKLGSKIN